MDSSSAEVEVWKIEAIALPCCSNSFRQFVPRRPSFFNDHPSSPYYYYIYSSKLTERNALSTFLGGQLTLMTHGRARRELYFSGEKEQSPAFQARIILLSFFWLDMDMDWTYLPLKVPIVYLCMWMWSLSQFVWSPMSTVYCSCPTPHFVFRYSLGTRAPLFSPSKWHANTHTHTHRFSVENSFTFLLFCHLTIQLFSGLKMKGTLMIKKKKNRRVEIIFLFNVARLPWCVCEYSIVWMAVSDPFYIPFFLKFYQRPTFFFSLWIRTDDENSPSTTVDE